MRDCLKSKGERLSFTSRIAVIAVSAPTLLLFLSIPLGAQTQTFTMEDVEFVLELPSPEWRAISRLDVHNHVEFINGANTGNGYLRLRKMRGPAGTTAADLFSYQETWELRSLTGYVVCSNGKGEPFSGRLNGAAFSYEYVSNGKGMDGRIYYLQIDSRTFYALHFTVASENLRGFRAHMESIARSFRLK
jgi:hypothetical protein